MNSAEKSMRGIMDVINALPPSRKAKRSKERRQLKTALQHLRGIVASANAQMEYDRGQMAVEIPKDDIRQIERFLKRIS